MLPLVSVNPAVSCWGQACPGLACPRGMGGLPPGGTFSQSRHWLQGPQGRCGQASLETVGTVIQASSRSLAPQPPSQPLIFPRASRLDILSV